MVQVGCTINYGRRGLWKETEECASVDYPGDVGENDSALPSIPRLRALVSASIVGLWRSWERASMAWKRSSVRSRPGPPNLSTTYTRRVAATAPFVSFSHNPW